MFCLFVSTDLNPPAELRDCRKALLHVPARAQDPYLDDGAAPAKVLQLYFDLMPALEAAASRLAEGAAQAMEVRRFPVLHPSFHSADGSYCTYLVAYEGRAQDEAAWHAEYLAHHPRLMASLPGIRELEVYLPTPWRCPAHLTSVRHLQRNKVAFDSTEALTAALSSPVRAEMRQHYLSLPRFSGRVTHYAMTTTRL